MNELKLFENEEFGKVRVLEIENEPWFVAKDVCDILELSNPSVALKNLDEDERTKLNLGRQGNTNLINESGLDALVVRSRKPEAKKFRKWITSEVLPSIRKHGVYMTDNILNQVLDNPDFLIGLLTNLKEEKEKRQKLEKEKEENKPLVDFATRILDKGENILVREVAKIASDEGYSIGERRLYNKLREWGYVCKSSTEATQYAINKGYMVVITRVIDTPYGHKQVHTSLVTPRGQVNIVERLIKLQKKEESQGLITREEE